MITAVQLGHGGLGDSGLSWLSFFQRVTIHSGLRWDQALPGSGPAGRRGGWAGCHKIGVAYWISVATVVDFGLLKYWAFREHVVHSLFASTDNCLQLNWRRLSPAQDQSSDTDRSGRHVAGAGNTGHPQAPGAHTAGIPRGVHKCRPTLSGWVPPEA